MKVVHIYNIFRSDFVPGDDSDPDFILAAKALQDTQENNGPNVRTRRGVPKPCKFFSCVILSYILLSSLFV